MKIAGLKAFEVHGAMSSLGVTYAELTMGEEHWDYSRISDSKVLWGPQDGEPQQLNFPATPLNQKHATSPQRLVEDGIEGVMKRLGVSHAVLTMDAGQRFELSADAQGIQVAAAQQQQLELS